MPPRSVGRARPAGSHGRTGTADRSRKPRKPTTTQTLPNGYCGLPVQKTCPHANACLTCPVILTEPEFLPELREQPTLTLTLIDNATSCGHTRVAQMNQQVADNLTRMIGELEDGNEETASASRQLPPHRRCSPAAGHNDRAPREGRPAPARHHRRHDHLRNGRPRSGRLPILALQPTPTVPCMDHDQPTRVAFDFEQYGRRVREGGVGKKRVTRSKRR
ncbi:hypothetical protein [Actinoplanes regularis]|uniref:hypothetical protein n=1 Tax=Actinoplanes regularis TaxID=52697 RepID=UPI001943E7C4|nr:hypothetical protein [Actinoplanes regularis]GIE88300.1 hypothetical protein Are01nite_47800 [Actinoplanes regularis]